MSFFFKTASAVTKPNINTTQTITHSFISPKCWHISGAEITRSKSLSPIFRGADYLAGRNGQLYTITLPIKSNEEQQGELLHGLSLYSPQVMASLQYPFTPLTATSLSNF